MFLQGSTSAAASSRTTLGYGQRDGEIWLALDLGDLLGSLSSFLCISSVAVGSVLDSPPCQSTHQHGFNPIDLICEKFPTRARSTVFVGALRLEGIV